MAKKMTAEITVNGKKKTISVWLDESTVEALEAVKDEEMTRLYIIDEYKMQLSERRETRRHQSLDKSMENGFDVADDYCLEDDVIHGMDKNLVNEAVKHLLPEQRELIQQVYFEGKEQKEIAREQGVDPTAIRNRLRKIYKKIKKFLN